MPAILCEEQEGLLALGQGDRLGMFEDRCLYGLALAIVAIEFAGQLLRLLAAFGGEQPGAEVAASYPSARIDARSENEAQMIGAEGWRNRRDPCERGQTWPLQTFQLAQALA